MDQQNSMADLFGPVIYSYTREMAINDGVLIDISESATEAGFNIPTAVTRAVWDRYIEWSIDDNQKQSYQDQSGRLWDIVWMARCGIISGNKGSQCESLFELYCIPRDGESKSAERTTLKIHIGPGDDGNPVVTIMLPNED